MIAERAILVAKTLPRSRAHPPAAPQRQGRRALPTGVADAESTLDELEELARSAGAVVVGRLVQRSAATDGRYLIGAGKAAQLRDWCRDEAVDLVIFNADLTPAQTHHLDVLLGVKVVDRTQLILDIFAQRARSREGQLQVELAQLRYLLPRLTGKGTMLSRLGGGIGTRGPGETQLEVDRRRIRQRIRSLEQNIAQVARTRTIHRRHRRQGAIPLVALVGYTNAGKSTLFNALTGAAVKVEDRPFATLDPTIRHVGLPRKTVIALSDTVGFVRQLPHALIAAFTATLEEVRSAQCLIHVIDRSHPDWQEQAGAVELVLEELGVATTPRVTVLNKIDRLAESLTGGAPGPRPVVPISALTGRGLDRLAAAVETVVSEGTATYRLSIPASRGDLIAQLHAKGRVLRCTPRGTMITIDVELAVEAVRQWGDQWAPFFTMAKGAARRRPAAVASP